MINTLRRAFGQAINTYFDSKLSTIFVQYGREKFNPSSTNVVIVSTHQKGQFSPITQEFPIISLLIGGRFGGVPAGGW